MSWWACQKNYFFTSLPDVSFVATSLEETLLGVDFASFFAIDFSVEQHFFALAPFLQQSLSPPQANVVLQEKTSKSAEAVSVRNVFMVNIPLMIVH
jgi:hypothetical protein